jgi:hypothetical protein
MIVNAFHVGKLTQFGGVAEFAKGHHVARVVDRRRRLA